MQRALSKQTEELWDLGQGLWEGKSLRERASPVGTLSPDPAVVAAALSGEVRVSYDGKGGGFGSVETNRRVEKTAIEFVRRRYEQDGWSVRSVEAEKVGYDCVVSEQTNRYT